MRGTFKADVAQLAEQLIRNQQVRGSNPRIGSSQYKGKSSAYAWFPFFCLA